jgi:hypothetical protein
MPPKPDGPKARRPFHRYFGLLLSDQLSDSPFRVELEFDVSVKSQMLDVLVVRRDSDAAFDGSQLPDGLTDLVDHNLITFKSHHEPLDSWAIEELLAHYVNYRKVTAVGKRLLPESHFKTFAVCARRPNGLFQGIAPTQLSPGVYELKWGVRPIRIVVAVELPEAVKNSLFYLFSAREDQIEYGVEHYRLRTDDISTVISKLLKNYSHEGLKMPYTIQDFIQEQLEELTPQQRMKGLKPEERLEGLKPEERLEGLKLPEILEGYSKSEIEAYLSTLNEKTKKKSKRKSD